MREVLWLFAVQGVLGGFDTVYYHEWRARLPALGRLSRPELRLHGVRSIIYAVLFSSLPHLAWQGAWAIVLSALILTEIVLTLADFVVEDMVRKPLGGVYKGERVMHAIMGLIYGAALAYLVPVLAAWMLQPTALAWSLVDAPARLRTLLTIMAGGVLVSGLRDLAASAELPYSNWPWPKAPEVSTEGGR